MDSVIGRPFENTTPLGLRLTLDLWDQMQTDVADRAPEEACGLIAGVDHRAQAVYPITNTLHSPTRYRLDPQQQWDVFQLIEQNGWELLAIYHSHPKGPNSPSSTDVVENYYPGVIHLIWSQQAGKWGCRGFLIQNADVREIPVSVDQNSEA